MIAQPRPANSSSAGAKRPKLRALPASERLHRKAEFFAQDPARRKFVRMLDDIAEMTGDSRVAGVYALLLWESQPGPDGAPIGSRSDREIAGRLKLNRETVATLKSALLEPYFCRYCEFWHQLARKLPQRYPTAKCQYVLLGENCAHVAPEERFDVAPAPRSHPPRYGERDKQGRFTTEPAIAQQMSFTDAGELAGIPANSEPARAPSPAPRIERAAAVRALVGEDGIERVPDDVLAVVAEHVRQMLVRITTVASLTHAPLTAGLAAEVLLAAAAGTGAAPSPAPSELTGNPANSVPQQIFDQLVRLGSQNPKNRTSAKQCAQIYHEELLPCALRDRDGDRTAADRLILDVLESERVRNNATPIRLIRGAAKPRASDEEPWLSQLVDGAPPTLSPIAKRFAKLPHEVQGRVLDDVRVHAAGEPLPRFTHDVLQENGLGGQRVMKYLLERVRTETS